MKNLYGFTFASGDMNYLDYGATWVRHAGKREYHFIELINWEDAVGGREAKEIGFKYSLSLAIVNLDAIPVETVARAFQSCGNEDKLETVSNEWKALACFEYGTRAPIAEHSTNNFHASFRELAKDSRFISRDVNAKRRAMSRKVNKLGSTASEYMRGDLTSALVRGIIADKPEAKIIGKMYAACNKPDWEK